MIGSGMKFGGYWKILICVLSELDTNQRKGKIITIAKKISRKIFNAWNTLSLVDFAEPESTNLFEATSVKPIIDSL